MNATIWSSDRAIGEGPGRPKESRSAPFELIFIDDGSSDGSSDVLDSLAARYQTVKVFHFDRNYGQSWLSMQDSSGRQESW